MTLPPTLPSLTLFHVLWCKKKKWTLFPWEGRAGIDDLEFYSGK